MKPSPYHDLSKRERQIMEVLHRLEAAAVDEVFAALPDAASRDAVRVTLAQLEKKGHVRHERDGRRYLFRPVQQPGRARRSAVRHLLSTFFGGSVPDAVSALLDAQSRGLSDEELERLAERIDEERRRREGEA